METSASLPPTQDERIMAALAHVTALIPFMGVIAPIVIWVTQREKSAYAGFQSLQAMVYQILNVVLVILGYICYFAGIFGSVVLVGVGEAVRGPVDDSPLPLFMILPFGIMLLLGLVELVFILYGLAAAVFCLQGRPFRYALLGDRVERYLRKNREPFTPPVS